MILPSLLEYSRSELSSKLDSILADLTKFKNLTQQPKNPLSLHLDFVLQGFAEKRKVQPSLDLKTVLELLENKLKDLELDLSVHLMGLESDLEGCLDFLEKNQLNPNFQAKIFVPEDFIPKFQKISKTRKNLKTGIWLDLNQWNQQKISQLDLQDFLLMTVLAGKSGQKLTLETKKKSLKIIQNNPEKNFIIDGGWSLQDSKNNPVEIQMVSYSSFWKGFKL